MNTSSRFNRHSLIFLLLLAVMILMGGCSAERKVAVAFAEKGRQSVIMVLAPDRVFKVNQKRYLLDSLGPVAKEDEDRILLENSLYLSPLIDSLFIQNYLLGYTRELTKFGFRVIQANNMEEFMNYDSDAYQINIAQIELEESIYTYRDELEWYGDQYYHDHNLNAVYVNTWFEVSKVNDNGKQLPVYFTTDMLADQVDGTFDFDPFKQQMRYMYNIDTINTDMLYTFAYDVGRVYAGYTFDLLLNKELDSQLTSDQRSDRYWRYDPYRKIFFLAGDDRMIPMDE